MIRAIASILCLALLTGAGQSGTGPAAPPKTPPKTPLAATTGRPVPFTLFRGKILFEASVAGRPVTVLLDNGADFSTIDSALVKSLGLPPGDAVNMASTSGNVSATMVKGVDLDIPGQFRSSNQMLSTDLAPFSKLLGRKLDMVLGGDVMRKLALGIDFQRRLFRFGRSGMTPAGLTAIPLHRAKFAAVATVQTDGKPLRLEVDLGFNGDVSLSPDAWTKVKPANVRLSDDVGAGANGALQPVVRARLPNLTLGGFKEHDLDVDVRSQPSSFEGQVDGLLGTATLERYDMVLDIGANTLWLRPRATPPARRIDRAGLTLSPDGSAFKVLHVSNGGPAIGAWKIGDRLCRVGGRAVDPASPTALDWRNGPEGSAVDLETCDGTRRRLILRQYY
jgi:predicted aspartyl protease